MRSFHEALRTQLRSRLRGRFAGGAAIAFFLLTGFATSASAVQVVDLHDLTWYVHVDLVTTARPLSFWQSVVDQTEATANVLLEGGSGPFDTPCCTRLGQDAAVSTFGLPGDGFDVIDSEIEQNTINAFGGPGANVYLVDSMTYCGGSFPAAIGCAGTPPCSGNPNDDPNLYAMVTVDAFELEVLPVVLAHERGHNSCLNHVSAAGCQIMRGSILQPGNGSCLSASECSAYRNGRTTTTSGLECTCHISQGVLEADQATCTEVASGVCSGGICADSSGDAGVRLMASAHPGSATGTETDDALVVSALTANWSEIGQILSTGEDVEGLAYAHDSLTLYGVIPTTGDDSIVTIDVATGGVRSTVASIANGSSELISMAYDPGATSDPSDDRLIMLEVAGTAGTFVWVDPASPSIVNVYGTLNSSGADQFTGLAYDSNQELAFASTPYGPDGLWMIDLTTCPPSPCAASQVPGASVIRNQSGLAFAVETGNLYLFGTAFSSSQTFYNIIDPVTGNTVDTLSVDVATPGGLAAVPEPGIGLGLGLGCAGLVWALRKRTPSL